MENDTKILEKILTLSTESKLADERLELQFESMNKRIETLEKISQTMADNLNDLRHIQSVLDQVSNVVHQNTTDIKDLKKKYYELEQKPVRDKAEKMKYVIDYIFKGLVAVVIAYLFSKIGLKEGI